MKTCPNCKSNHNKPGTYCSRSCSNISRGPRSEETKAKIRAAALANPVGVAKTKTGGANVKGSKRAPRMQTLCATCGQKFETLISNIKKFCSKSCIRLGGTRQGSGRAKTGYYQGIYCGSTYELAFLIWNIDHNKKIKRCEQFFPYTYNGKTHFYYPDFAVDDMIYEIKGRFQEVDAIKIATCNAILIDKNEIQPYIEYVTTKYGCHKSKLHHLYDSNKMIECKCCGTQFIPVRKKSIFCSQSCSAKTNRLKSKYFNKSL